MDELESILGIRPAFGGYHKTQGTKNALLNLGSGCYLEVLAIDYDNTAIKASRWMGIEHITSPRITRWALKSNRIESDVEILKRYNDAMGTIFQGSRKTTNGDILAWEMTLPLANPKIELIPFVVDWSDSDYHPTEKLNHKCTLKDIRFSSSTADKTNLVFDELGISNSIYQGVKKEISITIESPNGLISLI